MYRKLTSPLLILYTEHMLGAYPTLTVLLRRTRARLLARTLLSVLALLVMLAGCASMQEAEHNQALTFL